ncbi:MAG: HD-like signal output (HDOD) protein [Planctomycetota bacterium]|jgi:HD-like signal output (HDOD) protein
MKRILFVDDEQCVLDGLRRMLRGKRHKWEMTFLSSGEEALLEMEKSSYDVIVSDLLMPGMDGVTLLGKIKEKYPGVVRLILTAHSELEATLKTMPVAHQFLSKPCAADTLQSVVTRACDLRQLLDNAALQEMVGKIDSLPAVPAIYNELTVALADQDVCLDSVGKIVERDIAIASKILQLVNSSFFGVAKSIDSIRQATTYLGTSMLSNLVLSMEVFRSFDGSSLPLGFSIDKEQSHATLAGRIARHLLQDKAQAEQAFLAAMLHDVGKLILATKFPVLFAQVEEAKSRLDGPDWMAEEGISGFTHAEIGAYLLGIWGMPYTIVEAIANHHQPSRVAHEGFDVVGAVHVATGLAEEFSRGECASEEELDQAFDLEYLEAVGVREKLAEWREIAKGEFGVGDDQEVAGEAA